MRRERATALLVQMLGRLTEGGWPLDLVAASAVTIEQVVLADAQVRHHRARAQVEWRWKPDSPLRRAALAALADPEARGLDPLAVRLHGMDLDLELPPRAAIGLVWRYVNEFTEVLAAEGMREWTEIVHPTRTRPLVALRIVPADRKALAAFPWPFASWYAPGAGDLRPPADPAADLAPPAGAVPPPTPPPR